MPSESVAGFLDRAQASRVLFPEQVEQLIRQPDIPQSDLASLCEYLLTRGVLTRFQADAIREGRGEDLTFAGYPVTDVLGPCPGGTAYRALHPSLRTPLVLRRLRADWFAPADTAANYVGRARSFGMMGHPNLVHLLDAGTQGDGVYLVIDRAPDSADLDALAREVGGAMPGFLAAEYGRAVASALRALHERGGVHGDVRPANLVVGPLATRTGPDGKARRRPTPDAVVRLAEVGLVPVRPAATGFPPDPAALPYLPPERVDAGGYDPRGDLYSLGASLYFLLAGRPPFAAETPAEVLRKVRAAEPTPLAALRPDLPPDLVALVGRMTDRQPARRPQTAADVEAALGKFCRPGAASGAAIPTADPASSLDKPHPIPTADPASTEQPADVWGVGSAVFATAAAHSAADPAPRRRAMSAGEKKRGRMLLILGGLLHLTAIGLLVAWLAGVFDASPQSDSGTPKPGKKDDRPGTPPPIRKAGPQKG